MNSDTIQCVVAYAGLSKQYLWPVELRRDATITDALSAARSLSDDEGIPWEDAVVGIFGTVMPRSALVNEGDRVELYRPLAEDPKDRRRRRARHLGGSAGGGGSSSSGSDTGG